MPARAKSGKGSKASKAFCWRASSEGRRRAGSAMSELVSGFRMEDLARLTTDAGPSKVIRTGPNEPLQGDPLTILEKELSAYGIVNAPGMPEFTGEARLFPAGSGGADVNGGQVVLLDSWRTTASFTSSPGLGGT